MASRFAESRLANRADADDVVSEVFASVLAAIEKGRGPVGSFAPYLMTSLRNECYRVNRQRAHELVADADLRDRWSGRRPAHDPFVGIDEATVIREAFESLAPKFRDVLWRIEVDDQSYGELASRYRATSHAIAMLALRARRALGSAYLARHLAAEGRHREVDPACRDARPQLVSLVRETGDGQRRRQVETHLEACPTCRGARDELGRLNQHLRSLPAAPMAAAGAVGFTSLGASSVVKAQLAAWWSAATPAATSGLAALSVLSPVVLSHESRTDLGIKGVASEVVAASTPVPEDRRQHEAAAPAHGDHAGSTGAPVEPPATSHDPGSATTAPGAEIRPEHIATPAAAEDPGAVLSATEAGDAPTVPGGPGAVATPVAAGGAPANVDAATGPAAATTTSAPEQQPSRRNPGGGPPDRTPATPQGPGSTTVPTADPAPTSPPVTDPAPTAPPGEGAQPPPPGDDRPGNGHGRGNGRGNGQGRGHETPSTQPPATSPPQPEPEVDPGTAGEVLVDQVDSLLSGLGVTGILASTPLGDVGVDIEIFPGAP